MIRQEFSRIDPKRRSDINYKKKQFATATFQHHDYENRLNFYVLPPTEEITLEQFEEWAIHRLKILSELEACSFRNRTAEETSEYMKPLLAKYLPLQSDSSKSSTLNDERRKDHYSHFILRLAFSATEDLRRRFSRLETMLFRLRLGDSNSRERQKFIESLDFEWEKVTEEEKRELGQDLLDANGIGGAGRWSREREEEGFFKVDWERIPELVEGRKCFLRKGKAYAPVREQQSLVITEFSRRLDAALELTARALPRLDEDDRLSPILAHLSQSFTAPDVSYSSDSSLAGFTTPTAATVDALSQHFPLCMQNLHHELRKNHHLKHFGRLQYTLFLKGLGLPLEECILFWRRSFSLMTDEKFTKEYRYNIRHAYGDVGGDANRRGRGYSPFSCQKLLTEPLPGPGQCHGCPYRTFKWDNLEAMLRSQGVGDRDVLRAIKVDAEKKRYHIACNRVFEFKAKEDIKRVKEKGLWTGELADTIVHPNEYFKRGWLLRRMGDGKEGEGTPGNMEMG